MYLSISHFYFMAKNSILLISGKLSNSGMTTISGLNLSYTQDFLPSLLPALSWSQAPGDKGAGLVQWRCSPGVDGNDSSALVWLYPLLFVPRPGVVCSPSLVLAAGRPREAGRLLWGHRKPEAALASPARGHLIPASAPFSTAPPRSP